MILDILGSQIGVEKVFSIASILTSIWCYHYGSKNLDLWVLLIKNWPNDLTIGFESKRGPLKSVDEFGDAEEEILDLLNTEFLNEVEGYVEDVFRIGIYFHDL